MALLFAIVDESGQLSKSDLRLLQRAAQINAKHCAAAYELEMPLVTVFDSIDKIPTNARVNPVRIVDKAPDLANENTLAFHNLHPHWGPQAYVIASRSSGTFEGDTSIAEALTHETTEALVDPNVNVWVDGPAPSYLQPGEDEADRWQYAYEVADPPQTSYSVRVWGWRGATDVPVTNFVHPFWFVPSLAREGTGLQFDHARVFTRAFQVGPDGYAVVRNRRTGDVRPAYWSTRYQGRLSLTPECKGAARFESKRFAGLASRTLRRWT